MPSEIGSALTSDSDHWFWSRLTVVGECWLFTGKARCGEGGRYGTVAIPKAWGLAKKQTTTHRMAFYLTHGRWPRVARHTCDTPLCCRPEHILDGTHADNIRDAVERGRSRNGNLKLTPADWQAIRESSESSTVVAAQYGVHPAHVRSIRRGRTGRVYRP